MSKAKSQPIQTVVHFFVTEPRELRESRDDGLPGRLIARYQPHLTYRITDVNRAFVEALIKEGVAQIGVPPGSYAALGARVGGKITTSRKS